MYLIVEVEVGPRKHGDINVLLGLKDCDVHDIMEWRKGITV